MNNFNKGNLLVHLDLAKFYITMVAKRAKLKRKFYFLSYIPLLNNISYTFLFSFNRYVISNKNKLPASYASLIASDVIRNGMLIRNLLFLCCFILLLKNRNELFERLFTLVYVCACSVCIYVYMCHVSAEARRGHGLYVIGVTDGNCPVRTSNQTQVLKKSSQGT